MHGTIPATPGEPQRKPRGYPEETIDPPIDPSTPAHTELQTESARDASRALSNVAMGPPAEVPGYHIERFIGAGAFGQIWKARNLNTGREVAVKFYLHRGGVNWSLLSREVKSLVHLSADRAVVQVLEVGWDARPPYYIMEWMEGGSLADRLADGPVRRSDALRYFETIVTGLNRCHGKGVLHCDLKPANLLMGDDDTPRLTDFGQSRFSDDQTPALGTLFYMAPEQADLNATPDARWDVYAVGAILVAMLTGVPPHRSDITLNRIENAETLDRRLRVYRSSIGTAESAVAPLVARNLDRDLIQIAKRCLHPDPDQRYANVQNVLDDLHERSQSIARRPLLLMGIIGPVLILLATLIFGFRSITVASEQTRTMLRREAAARNQTAAAYAARSFELELGRYFDIVRRESNRPEHLRRLGDVLSDDDLQNHRRSIVDRIRRRKGDPLDNADRDAILASPDVRQLADYLSERLRRYDAGSDSPTNHADASRSTTRPAASPVRFATLFVTDASGTIMAIAYKNRVERSSNSAGRNFAYRTYYHGGRRDLDRQTFSIDSVRPLRRTHLSAAFGSTATGRWKVAISTPIRRRDVSTIKPPGNIEPPPTEPDRGNEIAGSDEFTGSDEIAGPDEIIGLFVATVDLGDLNPLVNRRDTALADDESERDDLIAAVVEARPGDTLGTILDHPLMRRDGFQTQSRDFRIPPAVMEQLIGGQRVDYEDPMAAADGGDPYDGRWIAAIEPVRLPDPDAGATIDDGGSSHRDNFNANHPFDANHSSHASDGDADETDLATDADLLVLVQYRLAKVFGPVNDLQRTLVIETALGAASSVLVVALLWYLVRQGRRWSLDDPRSIAADARQRNTESRGGDPPDDTGPADNSNLTETMPAE